MPVEALLAELHLDGPVSVLAELSGGPASNSYLLENKNRKLVLRIDKPLAATIGLDRQSEAEILAVVHKEGLGPEPICANPSRGWLLTGYIEGAVWDSRDIAKGSNLTRLGKLFKHLHVLPLAGNEFRVVDWAGHYSVQLGTLAARNLADRIRGLNQQLKQQAGSPVLCHNDPIAANIIDSGALSFIDWEYAGIGDAFFDLAVVVAHHDLNETAIRQLLAAYLGDVTPDHHHRLRQACELYDCLNMLWLMLVLATDGGSSERRNRLELLASRLAVATS
jgi:thiamine kinase-like enzyme